MCKWSTMRNIPYQCATLCFNCFNLDASKQAHLLIKVSLWPTCRYIRCIQISSINNHIFGTIFFKHQWQHVVPVNQVHKKGLVPSCSIRKNPGYTTHSLKMGVVVAKICRGSSAISWGSSRISGEPPDLNLGWLAVRKKKPAIVPVNVPNTSYFRWYLSNIFQLGSSSHLLNKTSINKQMFTRY